MKIQETVEQKYGKKYTKITDQVGNLDNLVIELSDSTGGTAKDFLSTYKKFDKAAAKLAALLGE